VPGWSLRVDAMDGRRVDRLRLTPVVDESGGAADTLPTERSRGGGSA